MVLAKVEVEHQFWFSSWVGVNSGESISQLPTGPEADEEDGTFLQFGEGALMGFDGRELEGAFASRPCD
jgi:hypothetical protein